MQLCCSHQRDCHSAPWQSHHKGIWTFLCYSWLFQSWSILLQLSGGTWGAIKNEVFCLHLSNRWLCQYPRDCCSRKCTKASVYPAPHTQHWSAEVCDHHNVPLCKICNAWVAFSCWKSVGLYQLRLVQGCICWLLRYLAYSNVHVCWINVCLFLPLANSFASGLVQTWAFPGPSDWGCVHYSNFCTGLLISVGLKPRSNHTKR